MISLIIPCLWSDKELFDTTVKCLETVWDKEMQIIVIADQAPYTVNVNTGFKAARGDIFIIGNNDLTFPEKWLTELLLPLERGYDIATCWTSDQDVKLEEEIEGGAKFGSLFAMHRYVYDTIGGFDEEFRGYFSDLDYRRRAMDAGFKVGKNLNLVVGHEAKATYKKVDPMDSEYLRSMRLYEIKHGEVE